MIKTSASRGLGAAQTFLLSGLWLFANDLLAQAILSPRPDFSITPPAVVEYQVNNEMEVFPPPEAVAHPDKPPFEWGPVSVRPHGFYRFLYATALPVGSNHVETIIQEFSPSLFLNLGGHVSLDYAPTWRFYSRREFDDTLDHNVRLLWGTAYEDWVFGLMQTYSLTSEPLVETGTQTDQENFLTALNASYQFNRKMSLDAAINQRITSAADFQSSSEWSTSEWLNYQFLTRLAAGFGFGFGYVDVEEGTDMTYQQFQGRVNWRTTDKLGFQIHGGAEVRQALVSGAEDVINPVAGASVQYLPFDHTQLSLNVNQRVDSALITTATDQNQVAETTSVNLHLNQRLFAKVFLDLDGAYNNSKYVAADTATEERRDDYYTFNARLSSRIVKRGTASIFYQYNKVSSSVETYTFDGSQMGFELEYRF